MTTTADQQWTAEPHPCPRGLPGLCNCAECPVTQPRAPHLRAGWKLLPGTPEYIRAHEQVRRERGPAHGYLCAGCCGSHAQQWAAVPAGFVPLCMACHVRYDRPAGSLRPVTGGHRKP